MHDLSLQNRPVFLSAPTGIPIAVIRINASKTKDSVAFGDKILHLNRFLFYHVNQMGKLRIAMLQLYDHEVHFLQDL